MGIIFFFKSIKGLEILFPTMMFKNLYMLAFLAFKMAKQSKL